MSRTRADRVRLGDASSYAVVGAGYRARTTEAQRASRELDKLLGVARYTATEDIDWDQTALSIEQREYLGTVAA